jgi:hypothetical protein
MSHEKYRWLLVDGFVKIINDYLQNMGTKLSFITTECDVGLLVHLVDQEMEECPIHC